MNHRNLLQCQAGGWMQADDWLMPIGLVAVLFAIPAFETHCARNWLS